MLNLCENGVSELIGKTFTKVSKSDEDDKIK